ncbi:hypothetical protein RB593_001062 [Gaeumannomyces tritici]
MQRDENTNSNSNNSGPPAPTPSHHSGDSSQHPSPDTIVEAMTPYAAMVCGEPSPQVSSEPEIIPLNTPLMTRMEDVACWHQVPGSTAPAQEEYDYDVMLNHHKFGLYPSPPPVPSALTLAEQQTGEASGVVGNGFTSADVYARADDYSTAFNNVDFSWPTISPYPEVPHEYNMGWQTQPQDVFASPQAQTSGVPALTKHHHSAPYQHQRFDTFALGSGPVHSEQATSAAPASSYSPLQYTTAAAAVDTPVLFAHSPTPDLGYSGSPTPSFSQSSCVTPRASFQHAAAGMGSSQALPVRSNGNRFAGGSGLVAGDGFAGQQQQQQQQQHGWQQGSGGTLAGADDEAFLNQYAGSDDHGLADAPSSTQGQSPSRLSSDQGGSAKKDIPYSKLIFQCFRDNGFKPMELQEIYDWFDKNTNKRQEDPRGRGGWMNSIRHNLSMNRAFTKDDPRESGPPQGVSGGGTSGGRRRKKGASPREKHATWYVTPEAIKAGGVLPTTRDRNKGRAKGGASRLCRQPQQYHQPPSYSLSSSSSHNNQFGIPSAAAGPSQPMALQLRGQDNHHHHHHHHHRAYHHHLPTSSPRPPPPPPGRPAVGYRGPGPAAALATTPLAHQDLHSYQPGFDSHHHHGLPSEDVMHLCGPQLQLPQQPLHDYQPRDYHTQQQQQQHYYGYLEHERRQQQQQQRDRLAMQQAPLQAAGGGGHQIGARYHGDYQQDAAVPPPPPTPPLPASTSSCYGVVPLMAPASLPVNPVSGTTGSASAGTLAPRAAAAAAAAAAAFENAHVASNAFAPINNQQQQQQQQPQAHPTTTPIKAETSPPAVADDEDADADADADVDVDVALLHQRHAGGSAADDLAPRPARPGSPLARGGGGGEGRWSRGRRRSHPGWSG